MVKETCYHTAELVERPITAARRPVSWAPRCALVDPGELARLMQVACERRAKQPLLKETVDDMDMETGHDWFD